MDFSYHKDIDPIKIQNESNEKQNPSRATRTKYPGKGNQKVS